MQQFKYGNKVRYTRRGKIGWEETNEAKQGGLIYGEVYTVSVTDYQKGEEGIKIQESDADTWMHPDHFTFVSHN